MEVTRCFVVPVVMAEDIRNVLQKIGRNDPQRRMKFLNEENLVAIPIRVFSKDLCCEELVKLKQMIQEHLGPMTDKIDIQLRDVSMPLSKKSAVKSPEKQLRENLKRMLMTKGYTWTDDISVDVPSHWERHGDLVLIPSSSFSNAVWAEMGIDVWKTVIQSLSCTRLAKKSTVSTNGYRRPQVHLLYGDNGWVEHIDNGIRYMYDVTRCMFSSGNITEKLRIATLDCKDEIVVDLYAGIGYFTLPYLVYTGVKHLHACEWNPDAVEALQKNLKLNGVHDRCTVHVGDNRLVCPKGVADRVNLGLIPSSREGWLVACAALKPDSGGILHIHHNVNTKLDNDSNTKCCENTNSVPPEAFRREDKCLQNQRNLESGSIDNSSEQLNRHNGFMPLDREIESTINNLFLGHGAYPIKENSSSHVIEREERNHLPVDTFNTLSHNHAILKSSDSNDSIEIMKDLMHSKWFPWAYKTSQEIKQILEVTHGGLWKIDILHIEHVKSYAPYVDHIVLDMRCVNCSFT